jgi:hypothetical protein
MNSRKILVTIIGIAALAVSATANDSAPAAPAPPTGSQKLGAFVGSWRGTAELRQPGKPAVKFDMKAECHEISGGWGVRCETSFNNGDVTLLEADLFGYDPKGAKVHWYAVTNDGETHDHVGAWVDDQNLSVRNTAADKSTEDIRVAFTKKNAMSFEAITTADGAETSVMAGSMMRR